MRGSKIRPQVNLWASRPTIRVSAAAFQRGESVGFATTGNEEITSKKRWGLNKNMAETQIRRRKGAQRIRRQRQRQGGADRRGER